MALSRRTARRNTIKAFKVQQKAKSLGVSTSKLFVPSLSLRSQKRHGKKKGGFF